MEELPKHLLSLFVSFMKTKSGDLPENEKLIRKMLGMKKVQSIIIDTMCKLEPIINDQVIAIKNQSPSKLGSNARESRLLILSRDIQHQMENYVNLQEGLSNVISIVESINFNFEKLPVEPLKESEEKPELVKLLEGLAGKPRQNSMEFEDISADVWSKHMEVEKMLKVEMEKYYNQLNLLEGKYFERMSCLKYKTANKIINLENELERTWNHFRLIYDQALMKLEDSYSREQENRIREDKFINSTSKDTHPKDYASAISKIKNLFMTRKILEKRKIQDEKLAAGLNNKVNVLNEKIAELKDINIKLLENSTHLSFCIEHMVKNSDIVQVVKEKALKLISKQKCEKLENLFKNNEVFEKFNLETLSKKYENIKEGISSICIHIKDENLKYKLSKLITDSKLDEVDRSSQLKHLQPPKAPISLPKKGKNSTSNLSPAKKQNSGPLPKAESALDKMKKAMINIDKDIADSHKSVEEVVAETIRVHEEVHYEIKVHDDHVKNSEKHYQEHKASKSSIHSLASHRNLESFSTRSEETLKDHKSTQVSVQTSNSSTQISPNQSDQVFQSSPFTRLFNLKVHVLLSISLMPSKQYSEFSSQTEKEPSFNEYVSNPNNLIRGLMSKSKNPQTDRSFKIKRSLDPTVSENLIIKKIGKEKIETNPENHPQLNESFDDSNRGIYLKSKISNQSRLEKNNSHNNTLPIEKISTICKSPTKIIDNKLVSLVANQNTYQSRVIEASEEYQKEFSLHAQAKGLKKMNFQDIQQIWEEVINRRILEGEKDKISVHLRGYLGTDKFDSEKTKIISVIEGYHKELEKDEFKKKNKVKVVMENWKKLMKKFIEKISFNFKSLIDNDDSATDILFKVAKNLKFVRHRLQKKKNKSEAEARDIVYPPEIWALNSSSHSPMETLKNLKRSKGNTKPRYLGRFMSKTPIKDKIMTTENHRLPYL